MNIEFQTRPFIPYIDHHKGWFKFYRFERGMEMWTGNRFYLLMW